MNNVPDNIKDWLLSEAHVVTGHPFKLGNCSCLPVCPEKRANMKDEMPLGFLVTHGSDVTYQDASTPECAEMLGEWTKQHLHGLLEETTALPSEYWYG